MKKRHAVTLTICALTLLVALLLSPDSLAWIMLSRLSPDGRLEVSDGNAVILSQSVYNAERGEYEWQECRLSAEDEYSGQYAGGFSFGMIDNVAELDRDNIVYLRLAVPVRSGRRAELNLSYFTDGGSRYRFYKGDRIDATTVIYSQPSAEEAELLFDRLYSIEDGAIEGEPARPFIIYEAAALGSDDSLPSSFDTEAVYVTESSDSLTVSFDGEGEGGYYYVYLKLSPNLEAYVESVNYLFDYMPCILDFNLQFTYSVG